MGTDTISQVKCTEHYFEKMTNSKIQISNSVLKLFSKIAELKS